MRAARWAVLLPGLLLPGLLLGGPALAADPGTVTTDATARDRLPNTVADVTLQTEVRARTLAEVQTTLTAKAGDLIEYLRTAQVRRTMTSGVDIEPEFDPRAAASQPLRVTGYLGRVTVDFQVDAGALGTVVSNALLHGANVVRNTDLHARQAEIDSKRQSLAAEATRRAIDEARAIATAAGRELGTIRRITVDSASEPSRPSYAPAGAAAPAPALAAPIPIAAGDSDLSTTITVTIDLVEPAQAPR